MLGTTFVPKKKKKKEKSLGRAADVLSCHLLTALWRYQDVFIMAKLHTYTAGTQLTTYTERHFSNVVLRSDHLG